MLFPEQSRAARGWLNWTQSDLADRASVSLSTVRDFEAGRRMPIANNLDAITRAIESAGIQLLLAGNKAKGVAVADDALVIEAKPPRSPGKGGAPRQDGASRAPPGKRSRG